MKRQSNALTAVLENWQDVENAIDIYANSAGSAMRENEIYLDSWEAKSKALSASWNEFVNTFLNADMFKGFIGGATEVLKWLTDVNAMLPIVAGLISGLLASAILKGTFTLEGFNAALIKTNILSGGIPMLIGAIVTLVGVGISWAATAFDTAKQIENLNTKIQEQQTEIDKLTAKEKDVVDLYKEYESLMSKSKAYGLNASEKENLLNISKELVDTYGLEVSGIDELTGAYIVGANAVNQYVEALRKERLEKEQDQTKARNDRINKNIKLTKKAQGSESDYREAKELLPKFEHYREELQKLLTEMKSEDTTIAENARARYNDIFSEIQSEINRLYLNEKIDLDESKVYMIFDDLIGNSSIDSNIFKYSSEASAKINSVVRDILTNIQVDNADMLDSNSESLLTQMLTPYLTTVDWEEFNKDEWEAKVKEFVTKASGTLTQLSAELKDSQSKMTSGDLNLTGYKDMYDSLQEQAGVLKSMLDEEVISEESYKEQVSQIYNQVASNIGLSMVEISQSIDSTDEKSKKAFQNIADTFITLENQFRQGTISSTQYLDSLTSTIESMDFTEVFGKNTEAAQHFFSTITSKTANILQDTITQFDAGKISVTEYGDRLEDFAKQQKALIKTAKEQYKAMGMSDEQIKELTKGLEEQGKAIDDASAKWEELRSINKYLDENIDTLRSSTNAASQAYQNFAKGLYSEFTKLSDETRKTIIANMNETAGEARYTAENLQGEMLKSVDASKTLATATATATNNVFKNLANNGGKVLTALGNAIKGFEYSIKFEPKVTGYMEESVSIADNDTIGGKIVNKLIKFKFPKIDFGITGDGSNDANLTELGTSLSNFGSSLSEASQFIDLSHYGKSFGGDGGEGGKGSPPRDTSGGGGGSKGSDSFDDNYYSTIEAWLKENEKEIKKFEDERQALNRQFENALESGNIEQANILRAKLAENTKAQKDILHSQNEAHRITMGKLLAELYKVAPELEGKAWEDISEVELADIENRLSKVAESGGSNQDKLALNTFKGIVDNLKDVSDAIEDNSAAWWDLDSDSKQYWQSQIDNQEEYSRTWIENQKAFDKMSDEEELAAYARMINNNKEFQKQILEDTSLSEETKLELIKDTNDKILDIEKDAYDKRKELFDKATDFGNTYLESKKTLLQAHFNVTNAIVEAQHQINKELETSKTMYEYLDEETRELLFNQEDYNKLSKELLDIQNKADVLQRQYKSDLEDSTLETIEKITSNYQMQYETLMKSYEIAKADLEVAKKKAKLNNVLNERNVRMFINGSWQWVANTEDVINAKAELADAQYAKQVEEAGLTQKQSIDNLTKQQDELGVVIKKFENGVIDLGEAVGKAKEAIGDLPDALETLLKDIGSSSSSNKGDSSNSYSNSSGSSGSGGGGGGGGTASYIPAGGTSAPKSNATATIPGLGTVGVHVDSSGKTTTSGLPAGTVVHTGGGDYKITGGTGGSNGSYTSVKVEKKLASGTKYTEDGLTLMGEDGFEAYISSNGRLIPISQPTIGNIPSGGVVFNTEQMKSLRTLWDMSNLNLSGGANLVSNSRPQQIDQSQDNRIIINGMTVDSGSADGQALISALRRYVGNH